MTRGAEALKTQLIHNLKSELKNSQRLVLSLKAELSDTKTQYSIQNQKFKKIAFESTHRDYMMHHQQETIDKQRKYVSTLMADVERLSTEISTLSEKIKNADEVSAIINHDIRSAITTWINTTDLLLADPDMKQEGITILQEAKKSALNILSFVDMQLSLAKLECGTSELELEPINVFEVVLSVISQNKHLINDKNLSLPPPIGTHGETSKTFLILGCLPLTHIILNNLLVNAIEASPVGAEIIFSFEMNDHCKISIHNFGEVPEKIRGVFLINL
ncbi:MAG: sensor histidine kinase [Thermodesulfobacteriota bacterium]